MRVEYQGVRKMFSSTSLASIRVSNLRYLFVIVATHSLICLSSVSSNPEVKFILNDTSIAGVFAEIDRSDRDYLEVEVHENNGQKLFGKLKNVPTESYEKTMELIHLFNPKTNSNDHRRLQSQIDAYVDYLSNFEVIKIALARTNTTIQQLRKNWFGSGRGFEHIIAGELKGRKVSGYHWWYRYFIDQKKGLVKYVDSKKGVGDPNVFIGSFYWDPDGSGPLPLSYKKLGGFHIGQSAPALIAAGHVAMEFSKRSSSYGFAAPYRGQTYYWQTYSVQGNLRTMFCKIYKHSNAYRSKMFLNLHR